MNDYIISVNSTIDIPRALVEEKGIPVLPLKYTIDGETYVDREGLSPKEFFGKLREGKMAVTSQVNPDEAREKLEPFLKAGKDVLHLAFSSGLSGTYNSVRLAAEELLEEYPDRKIMVLDTKCACMGEGILLHYVLKQKEEGASLEEAYAYADELKEHVGHYVTVDDLNHLYKGGRLSKTSAVLGSMIKIKPIIVVNEEGKLEVVAKERGRKKSINKIVDMAVEHTGDFKQEIVMITHGDCLEEAEYLASVVKEKIGVTDEQIVVNNIGTVIGGHTGPGVLAVFCLADKK
ncbi:MAG: DegV family protein [Dorea sp.]